MLTFPCLRGWHTRLHPANQTDGCPATPRTCGAGRSAGRRFYRSGEKRRLGQRPARPGGGGAEPPAGHGGISGRPLRRRGGGLRPHGDAAVTDTYLLGVDEMAEPAAFLSLRVGGRL